MLCGPISLPTWLPNLRRSALLNPLKLGLPRFTLRPRTFTPNCSASPIWYEAALYFFRKSKIDGAICGARRLTFALPNTTNSTGRKRRIVAFKEATICFVPQELKRVAVICPSLLKSESVAKGNRSIWIA